MERAEKIGLGIASAGHVLLFAALSAGLFAAPEPLRLKTTPMDVSLVDEVALEAAAPRLSTEPPPSAQAPAQGPVEEAAPAPAPAEPSPTPPPPAPKPLPKSPPKADPAPKPRPVEKAKPLPRAASEPKPSPKPQPKAPAKPAPTAKAPAKPAPAAPAAKPAPKAPAKAQSGAGTAQASRASRLGPDFLKGIDGPSPTPATKPAQPGAPADKMSAAQVARLNDVISQQIYRHLRLPSGADVEMLVASLDVKLARDGSVVGRPQVLDVTGQTASNKPQVSVYKERAVQAVLAASPFQNLPAEYYEQWRWLSPLRVYARRAQ